MKIYIANCSKCEHLFTYMLPENMRPFSHNIRAGHQIELNASKEEIDIIIKQHTVYGFQEASKVKKGFGGIAYRLDKPISIEAIEAGISQTDQEQIQRALEARKLTAVASDQIIGQKAQELGIKQTASLEIEVQEEKRNVADHDIKFNETIEVVHDFNKPKKNKKK